jgi:hypothetical protein
MKTTRASATNQTKLSIGVDSTDIDPHSLSLLQTSMNREERSIDGYPRNKSPTSHYRFLPTENTKFQKFLDALYSSDLNSLEIKEQIMRYLSVIEEGYKKRIHENEVKFKKAKREADKVVQSETTKLIESQNPEQNDFEGLFNECIEETKKEVMKRRLRMEIQSKKNYVSI